MGHRFNDSLFLLHHSSKDRTSIEKVLISKFLFGDPTKAILLVKRLKLLSRVLELVHYEKRKNKGQRMESFGKPQFSLPFEGLSFSLFIFCSWFFCLRGNVFRYFFLTRN